MENGRNRVDIELVKKSCLKCLSCKICTKLKACDECKKCENPKCVKAKKRYEKVTSHPTFKKRTIFNENLVAVHKNIKEIKLDKPILNGMIILDLSKYLMYDFYYNVLKNKYGDKIKLLFTDTDSLCLEVETEDIYDDMLNMKEYFDCSECPKYHKIYSK